MVEGIGSMDDFNTPYYLLRWSDHITNYAEVFLTLRDQEEFVDCSLACEDGVVGAHRLVLAGCSSYLRDLLKRSSNPHPVILLIGVSRSTVLLLMEFIYRGQAHIPHSRLRQLVSLGRAMKIKGLCQIKLPEENVPEHPAIPRFHGSPEPIREIVNHSTPTGPSQECGADASRDENMSEEEDSMPLETLRTSGRKDKAAQNLQEIRNTTIVVENQERHIPEKRVGSPEKRVGSPEKRVGRPEKRAGSPEKRAGSPEKRAGSPEKRAGSPVKRAGSPEKNVIKKVVNPEKRVGSPENRIGSPKQQNRAINNEKDLDSLSENEDTDALDNDEVGSKSSAEKPEAKTLRSGNASGTAPGHKLIPGHMLLHKTHYIPKPKSKQSTMNRDVARSATKTKEVKITKTSDLLKATKSKPGPKKKPILKERDKKVKQPVYKINKPPTLKKLKEEPNRRLTYGKQTKMDVGAYSLKYGVDATRRYVLAKYGTNIRTKSIDDMTKFYITMVKRLKKAKQNAEEEVSPLKRGRPKKELQYDESMLDQITQKSLTFDEEKLQRSKRKSVGWEEGDKLPFKRSRDHLVE